MNRKSFIAIIGPIIAAGGEYARHILRYRGQKILQERVDSSAPAPTENNSLVDENHIQLTLLKDECVDLTNCQEIPMSDDEANEWKVLFSTIAGETAETVLAAKAFNGLLKCDVPLKDLCRVKDNPEAMRGFVMNDGKISKHASFSEASLSNIAPLLVYQYMAAVTSQYYQHIITERLNIIETNIDTIIKILTADDQAKLKVSYNRFLELSKKTTYDIADKQIVSEFSGYVEIVREKYRNMLSNIDSLNINYQWSDKKEAELKIQTLQNSRYFDYLDMVMQAETLTFIASAISMKIAKYLGSDEDVKIYAKRMDLDYWYNYIDQFNKIKHDVITYLELEAESSWMQGKSIIALKNAQLDIFNKVEKEMMKLQDQFEYKTVQYFKFQEDGELKKYISFSKEK